MRLVIDLQAAQGPSRHRGIGRYSLALTRGLLRSRGEHEVFIALNGLLPHTIDEVREALAGMVPDEHFLVWDAPGPVDGANPEYDARREAAELIRESALAALCPDFILASSIFEGFGENIVTSIGRLASIPTATVLYDLIPLIHRQVYLPNEQVEKWYESKLGHLKNADLLLAISESSRQEALDWLGVGDGQAVNISTAADDHFSPAPVDKNTRRYLEKEYGLERPFVMYTGGIDHRKNIEGLISAFARLPLDVRCAHQLAIVCSVQEPDRHRLLKLAQDEGLASGEVVLTGFISEEDLLACYRSCKLFVFPSWHEGFGLPALEAMKCGRAVVVGNRSGLPEVVGLESALFDPFDIDSIQAKILEVLTDDRFRAELERHGLKQAGKFDWNNTAQRAWAALEASHKRRTLAGLSPATAPKSLRRPRMAFVAPLAPDASGISDYCAELLPELAKHYRIDVVHPRGTVDHPWIRSNCAVRDTRWFRHHAYEYDRVLYHFGNSQFHSHMFDLLHDIPGVVVLHDFFLSGVVSYREGSGEKPGAWSQALSYSHGWQAVSRRYAAKDPDEVLWEYPCNLPVLQDALGIIVHADYSKQLAQEWYGSEVAQDWQFIPHLRQSLPNVNRERSREELGIPADDIVVCSFGVLGSSKMNHRLIEAWLDSPLGQDPRCHLVFVGQNDQGEYGSRFERMIRSSKLAGRVEITGWADHATFRRWLDAADIAVQLRTLSRGETSGTVLDCMNSGVATIVNAHGSMAELPRDAVFMLKDEFDDADLRDALVTLWRDQSRRLSLGARAKEHIKRHHQPRQCAASYAEAIERYYARAASGGPGLIRAIMENDSAGELDWINLSGSISRSLPLSPRRRRLLVDVSVLVQVDARSGIQRVVRSILSQWLAEPPLGWMVEPVYADLAGRCYRYARRFTSGFLSVPDYWCEDDVVETYPGDIFVALDYHPEILTRQHDILQEWRLRGIHLHAVIYDLLPVLLPEHFPAGTKEGHEGWLKAVSQFDSVACISRSVADEFKDWLENNAPERQRPLLVNWFHLGADTEQSLPTKGKPSDAEQQIALLREGPSFLAVGTIEPRKGHRQVLAAFEALWAQGVQAKLVIVGKMGWQMDEFAARLRGHPEIGRRMFWLESITDEYLDDIYRVCSCLLVASEGEGFGLPLVEAARHGIPALARDIPVFREVAGPNAVFFANKKDPKAIADAVKKLLSESANSHKVDKTWITWKKSSQDLLACILQNKGGAEDVLHDGGIEADRRSGFVGVQN
ncbi:glycosyltransferase [Sphingobium bisphenolivorans]|uniref:glycosyltransferase n=1 Tax=Sphingobium bisphenolivorans TaxID=1335760 RepID=UPI0003A869BA|nr:glycosyltransferase [Sphingobium bisphenolivorans]